MVFAYVHPFSDKWIMDANIAAISSYCAKKNGIMESKRRGKKIAICEKLLFIEHDLVCGACEEQAKQINYK